MNGPSPQYDLVVVGGGIAGLCIAEIFARSGWRTALLERNATLCAEASGAHHGWFHFGSLYSIFPNNQFMRTLVGGVDDLIDYYSQFPGMNIRVNDQGRLTFPEGHGAWIRDEPIQYIVAARNNPDFSLHVYDGLANYVGKLWFTLTWDLAIKQFISRHQRFHKFDWRRGPASANIPRAGWRDYSRAVIFKPERSDYELDPDTHFRVSGFDRPMVPRNITTDLLRSFLGCGGTLIPRCEYQQYHRAAGIVAVRVSDREITTKRLVLATGKGLREHIGSMAHVNVVASPLLIAYPAVSSLNFARLTPFVPRTINHLRHYAAGEPYSVIGGGYSAPATDSQAITRAEQELTVAAARVFPALRKAKLNRTYVSYKTEISSERGERNYQYLIRKLDEDVFAVVPGKFSLGFSLAVNLYKRIVGAEPSREVKVRANADVSPYLAVMAHEREVMKHFSEHRISMSTAPATAAS